MAVLKFGKGRSEVTISGALAERLDRELRDVLGPVADELQRHADEILRNARAQWPVKSGRSQRSWDTALRIQPGSFEIEVSMFNTAGNYVNLIRSTKIGRQKEATRLRSPTSAHVRKPRTEARRELRKTLPKILGEHLERKVLRG